MNVSEMTYFVSSGTQNLNSFNHSVNQSINQKLDKFETSCFLFTDFVDDMYIQLKTSRERCT